MHSVLSETVVRKVALYVGLAALVVGMGMAFEYGRAMSYLHAVSLGLLAVAVSLAFIGAEMYRQSGRHTAALIATIAGVAFSVGEYGTHFGYTVGTRIADSQQTSVTNATYAAVQKNRDSEGANLDIWKKQLATLMDQNAWATTVKAEALRAEAETLKVRIDEEKAGKRGRAPGCKTECERLQNALLDVEKRIGVVEQAADLTKRIEATQRILDKKVDVAASTEYHSSKIVNQTEGFAQIATWSDEPSKSALGWTQLVLGAIIAAITTYLAPFCLSLAFSGLQRRKDPQPIYQTGNSAHPMPSQPLSLPPTHEQRSNWTPAHQPIPQSHHHVV
ncbi:MAG: hypothetical protein KGL35_27630, partial [Bradyrhizobium sp.]|nr:hypothetical protein [Bradyrhizobium sp.]